MTLPRSFYDRDTVQVARELLGKKLIRVVGDQELIGIIAETEAYRSDDPACHAYRGKTERNAALFGPVGHIYVYFTYGMHFCCNLVSRDTATTPAGGILIRAIIPLEGHDFIKTQWPRANKILIKGPGNVAKSLVIDRQASSCDVTLPHSPIRVLEGVSIDEAAILTTERIGISVAQEKLWRFLIDSPQCAEIVARLSKQSPAHLLQL